MSLTEREETIPALANRAYHLPGYSGCSDWIQFMVNNHPLLGICCYHRLHPIGVRMRLVQLVGSVMFGLVITNIVWLWCIFNEIDQEQKVISVTIGGVPQNTTISSYEGLSSSEEFTITQGMVILWTVGVSLHAIFDQTIWFITACSCCLPGQSLECLQGCRKYSNYLAVVTVVICTAAATFFVLVRAALEEEDTVGDMPQVTTGEDAADDIDILFKNQHASAYDFLISYATELVLALFVYNPLVGTILFSGILGCGSIPGLGGRPYELKQEEKKRAKEPSQSSCNTIPSSPSDRV
jgi:hypothetical protein